MWVEMHAKVLRFDWSRFTTFLKAVGLVFGGMAVAAVVGFALMALAGYHPLFFMGVCMVVLVIALALMSDFLYYK